MLYRILFQFEDGRPEQTIQVPRGTPLSAVAAELRIPLRNPCGGNGTCGKCKVLLDGKEHLLCRTAVQSDLTVTVPKTSQNFSEDIAVQTQSFLVNSPKLTVSTGCSSDSAYGIALDIGTTTLAAELFELSQPPRFAAVTARANPQRSFGDDLITRIQKVIEEPAALGALQHAVITAANEMFTELCAKAGISTEDITAVSVAGNTVMQLLFLGIDPSPLGFAPFSPPLSVFPDCSGTDIGLNVNGTVKTLPVLGGFVGGDIVAGVLAIGLHQTAQTAFFIDIGTNGEIVLCYDGKLYTAATAAGPAFEGSRIEYGMIAVPGAVDRIELRDAGQVHFGTIGNVPPKGICGSALLDAVAELLRNGLIKPNGQFNVKADSPFLKHWRIINGKPAFCLVSEENSGIGEAILLTQQDIRQVQLAVGAVRAGIRLLLERHRLRMEDVETFYVAGGFGSFLRPENAQRIGLLPPEIPLERIRCCGNTSLAGARLTLLDPSYRSAADAVVASSQHIELASLPEFAVRFAECMMFD